MALGRGLSHQTFKATKSGDLDRVHTAKDKDFPEQQELTQRFSDAMDEVIGFEEIHKGPLMRPHIFYALVLAIIQVRQPVEILKDAFVPPEPFELIRDIAITNLSMSRIAPILLDRSIPARTFYPHNPRKSPFFHRSRDTTPYNVSFPIASTRQFGYLRLNVRRLDRLRVSPFAPLSSY